MRGDPDLLVPLSTPYPTLLNRIVASCDVSDYLRTHLGRLKEKVSDIPPSHELAAQLRRGDPVYNASLGHDGTMRFGLYSVLSSTLNNGAFNLKLAVKGELQVPEEGFASIRHVAHMSYSSHSLAVPGDLAFELLRRYRQ